MEPMAFDLCPNSVCQRRHSVQFRSIEKVLKSWPSGIEHKDANLSQKEMR
jgi:hypothetical protein